MTPQPSRLPLLTPSSLLSPLPLLALLALVITVVNSRGSRLKVVDVSGVVTFISNEKSPAGRVGQPDEIAAAIAFLATEQASFIHGVLLPVDGGRLAV